MKALGVQLLDKVCYLAQLECITADERVEYANLIGLAMRPGHDQFYDVLQKKLRTKARTCPDNQTDYFDETLALFYQGAQTR